jgi:hypothetical protein
MNRLSLTFAVSLLSLVAVPVFAQTLGAEPLSLTIDPQYPRPYQTITITPESSLIDLSSSVVTISANGAVIEKGSGMQSAQVQMGGPGTKTTITVSVLNNGRTTQAQATVRPADVALVVEPTSTTHPFYAGSPLLASEGRVRLVAIADLRTSAGAAIPASSLVYTWKNGDQILQAASGIGKSVLVAKAPVRYRDATITVTVAAQDSSVVAQAGTTLTPVEPVVRLYRNDPLIGPWYNTALSGRVTMGDTEETFRAVPYFFTKLPSINWQVNGTASETNQDITVRENNGSGTAVLGVSAKDATGTLSNTSMTVDFGGKKSIGIFGL